MTRVGGTGCNRMVAKTSGRPTPFANLRPSADYALEWEAVDDTPAPRESTTALVGLSNEDRLALGLSPLPAPAVPRFEREGEDARVVLSRALR